jgi:iron(III) transport system substrate-binding protein
VIIYNTDLISDDNDAPDSLSDFLDPTNRGKAAIAKPLFGTTATHAAALFASRGPDDAKLFFKNLADNDVAVLAGNATVRDQVAQGEYHFGLTDTDDAVGALLAGKPVRMVFPDQDGDGTLLIPNTVALIKDAPHPEHARALIDFILSRETEEALARGRSSQIPLRPGIPAPRFIPPTEELRFLEVDFNDLLPWRDPSMKFIRLEFLKGR